MDYNKILRLRLKEKYPMLKIKPGYFIEIREKVGDGDKQRIWKFKGLVIKVKKPNNPDGTFTVRGEVAGVMVEKVYPFSFPNFEKVLLLDEYKIRRAKLYYIREKVGKAAKFKSIIDRNRKGVDLLKEAKEALENELKNIEQNLSANVKKEKADSNNLKKEDKKLEEVEKNNEKESDENPSEEKKEKNVEQKEIENKNPETETNEAKNETKQEEKTREKFILKN